MSVVETIQTASLSHRDRVHLLEDAMREHPQRLDIKKALPVTHHFSPGVYAREMFIPAGTLVTGRIHKRTQLNILSAGELTLVTEEGCVRISAPFHVVSPPGTKRAVFAHTDCVFTTILGTDETDPEKIEAQFTAGSEAEYQAFLESADAPKEIACHSD
jgi:hypothetical protein